MSFSDHKTRRLLLALLMGAYMAASGLNAQQSSTADGAKKPAAHPSTGSAQSTTTPTPTKKAGATTPTHPASSPKAVPQTGAAKSAATSAALTKAPATKAVPTKTVPHNASASAAKSTPNKTAAHAPQRAGTPARYRRSRPLSGAQRLARLRLEPERVQEIQQALIREGYLHGDANGQWDTATRDAMLHYQTDHGFPATGLPEAKSLMKLGLGSHPLPAELDHSSAAGAGGGSAQGDATTTAPLPPVSRATPPPQDSPPPE